MRLSTLAILALPLAGVHAAPAPAAHHHKHHHHHHHHHDQEAASTTTTDLGLLVTSLFTSPFSAVEAFISSFTKSVEDVVTVNNDVGSSIDTDVNAMADPAEKTIWQLLNEQPDKYSKIVKLIALDEKAKDVLDDRSKEITFFAPDNAGIPDPRHHDDDDDDDDGDEDDAAEDEESDIQALLSSPSLPSLHAFYSRHSESLGDLSVAVDEDGEGDDDDDEDEDRKERRKKIFKLILRAVLKYHGLPSPVSATELAGNSTWPTALKGKFGASDGEALRLRVEKSILPPSIKLNFYAKVVITDSDVKAKNGYLHTVDHPLLPPPSLLTAAFLFPKEFSTLTSAVQKVHGQKYLEWDIDPKASREEKKPVFRGSPAVTLFAPTNDAFNKLPEKLTLFLFSPFGEKILTKILAYHALPNQILFSEHYHIAHSHGKDDGDKAFAIAGDSSFHKEFEADTGLEAKKLKIVVDKSRILPVGGAYKTSIKVNDVEVEVYDVPALNGVGHSIPDVLVPPHKHKGDDFVDAEVQTWDNWESWLMDWANSA